MSRRLPERVADPLYAVRAYVDRRAGMRDDAREARKRRIAARQADAASTGVGSLVCRRVTSSGSNVTTGSQGSDTATCASGEWALGGGGLMSGTGATSIMIGSTPGDPPTSWTANFYNPSGSTDTITAYAVCCKLE